MYCALVLHPVLHPGSVDILFRQLGSPPISCRRESRPALRDDSVLVPARIPSRPAGRLSSCACENPVPPCGTTQFSPGPARGRRAQSWVVIESNLPAPFRGDRRHVNQAGSLRNSVCLIFGHLLSCADSTTFKSAIARVERTFRSASTSLLSPPSRLQPAAPLAFDIFLQARNSRHAIQILSHLQVWFDRRCVRDLTQFFP